MPSLKQPRSGSLQFYPRVRAEKFLPRVNWRPIPKKSEKETVLGIIAYKVGMATAIVKDMTEKVLSSGKQIPIPVTILEVPQMKIYAIRFYKNNIPFKDIVVTNDRILKKVVRIPKTLPSLEASIPSEYDDVHILIYTLVNTTSIKKTPDIAEIAITAPNKQEFVKALTKREISLSDFLRDNLIDIRGITIGKGTQGPVKRFGISLKQHKSEKGVRRPGSLGPWHPARVTFRAPLAGQLGFFSRIAYNSYIITAGKIAEKDINPIAGFRDYGKIKTSYLLVKGSVMGPPKRQLLLTHAFRKTHNQEKRKYQFIELITGA